jgi:hypothetical protein
VADAALSVEGPGTDWFTRLAAGLRVRQLDGVSIAKHLQP